MTDLVTTAIGLVVAVLVVMFYGKNERKKGRRDLAEDLRKADAKGAAEIKDKLDENRNDRDGVDPVDRLSKAGRLRD